jgi:hypothetical protein
VTRFWQSSNAQCKQCNHTHSENQHCKCYRIVVQPMQPLLHGTPPRSRSIVGKLERHRDNFSGRIGFRCSERKAPERLSQAAGNQKEKPRHWAKVVRRGSRLGHRNCTQHRAEPPADGPLRPQGLHGPFPYQGPA